jgi:hypothetical protein
MSAALRSVVGVSNITSASDFADGAVNMAQAGDGDTLLLPKLGVAVVAGEPDRLASLTAAVGGDERIEAIEPKQTLYALSQPGVLAAEYLRGYRDAAVEFYDYANGDRNGGGRGDRGGSRRPVRGHPSVYLGLVSHPGLYLCAQRPRHAGRDPRHRIRPAPRRLRRPSDHQQLLRAQPDTAGRPRSRYPLHRYLVGLAAPAGR